MSSHVIIHVYLSISWNAISQTGLFSAAVAALLGVTVQDLRPNSQDTSAFYLGNIYEVLADPNATRASIPSPVAKPPPFSPPRYAVWVNSLWFLSLVMSLSCALWATTLHQCARRYFRLTLSARGSPEKRARTRAFLANGVEKMHVSWAAEGLPTLIHLSLFLFFGGLVIFLFNVDREVFTCVVWWIGLFSTVYGLITLLPLIRQDSPYYSPLSIPAWFLYASIQYVTFQILAFIALSQGWDETWDRFDDLVDRCRGWMLGGVERKAEETAEEQSPKIDIGILGWTISTLGDDDSLEKFIEAIPGFFNSKLVKDLREHLPHDLSERLTYSLDGFVVRTFSSDLVIDKVKLHRLDISLSAMNLIHVSGLSSILRGILFNQWDQMPKTVDMGHTLARWCTSKHRRTAQYAQALVAKILATVRERGDRWVGLAVLVSERYVGDIVTRHDDSVLLALLIQVTRNAFRFSLDPDALRAFTQTNIRNTLSGLQHDFCTLWNEIVQEAKKQGSYRHVHILREIRHHYIALHQGPDAAPTTFSLSADNIPWHLSLYPLCDIASHRPADSPDALPGHSTSGGSTASPQVNEATIFARPPPLSSPIIPSEIEDSSQATSHALPVHTSPRPTDVSPLGAVAAALQNTPLAATLSHPPEGNTQRDIAAPCTEPDITEKHSTASLPAPARAPTLVPVPASTPPVLIKSFESCDAGAAPSSNPLLPASSVYGFSIHASPPPSRIPPLPDAESLTFLSSTTPSRSTGNATLPRIRARGLVNTRSMCFVNAVLQLLVHSPPLWDLFRELGDLKGTRGAGLSETSDGVIPLVDATLNFFEEFRFKEKERPQEPPQQVAGGNVREDEETQKDIYADSFKPSYMYDAMKEKIQLKNLLVRFRATYRPVVIDPCWPNV